MCHEMSELNINMVQTKIVIIVNCWHSVTNHIRQSSSCTKLLHSYTQVIIYSNKHNDSVLTYTVNKKSVSCSRLDAIQWRRQVRLKSKDEPMKAHEYVKAFSFKPLRKKGLETGLK